MRFKVKDMDIATGGILVAILNQTIGTFFLSIHNYLLKPAFDRSLNNNINIKILSYS